MKQTKETASSNDSLKDEVKAVHWGETITVTNHKDFTCFINPFGNNDAGIPSSEDRQAANLICEAVNNYNALKQSNKELIEALHCIINGDWSIDDARETLDRAKQL